MNFIKKLKFILLLTILVLVNNCTSPTSYYTGDENYINLSTQNQLTQDTLTLDSKNFLETFKLTKTFHNQPDRAIKICIKKIEKGNNIDFMEFSYTKMLKIISELCIYEAKKTDNNDIIKYWTTTCLYSYLSLFKNKKNSLIISPDTSTLICYYNYSLLKIFTYLQKHKKLNSTDFTLPMIGNKISFNNLKSNLPWKITSFQNFISGYNYQTKNFNVEVMQEGIGIPLGGIPKKNEMFPKVAKYVRVIKYMYPCTFLINFQITKDLSITASPNYIDYYKNVHGKINETKIILPNTFTVLLGEFLKKYPHSLNSNYFFDPETMFESKTIGIYMMSEYDKNKIPIVFIHGLISDPQSFAQLLNTLMQSQAIRENYQIWFFYYPTGQPIILNAHVLREALNNINLKLNSNAINSKFNDTILLGYSLGGLIAKLVIQSSNGDSFKNMVLHNENELKKSKNNIKSIKKLNSILCFEPLPFIKDVIFISTPHKGAEMASWLALQLWVDLMVTSPRNYNKNLNFISQLHLKYNDHIISGNAVYNLNPKSSFVKFTQNLLFSERTKIYSIIGDQGGPQNPTGTDGMISYDSTHLNNAAEEIIIKSNHHPITIPTCAKEVFKILLNNLKKNKK
jgi:hypothetical protein